MDGVGVLQGKWRLELICKRGELQGDDLSTTPLFHSQFYHNILLKIAMFLSRFGVSLVLL